MRRPVNCASVRRVHASSVWATCLLALLVGLASGAATAQAAGVRLWAAPDGRLAVRLVGRGASGSHVFFVDGRRVLRSRRRVVRLRVWRRDASAVVRWRRLVVRRARSGRLVARTLFAVGASRAPSAPTLVLLHVRANGRAVALRFSVRGGAARCQVDDAPLRPCAGRIRYRGLPTGAHTFVVRAANPHGSTTVRVTATISARAPAPSPAPGPPRPGARPCGAAGTPPSRWDHVVWIVFENKRYEQIIGSPDAPYLNSIARLCGSAASFFAEAHPSLPDYIAMTSGSTQGITDDSGPSSHPLAVPSLFSQLGSGWRSLDEGMSSNCELSDSGDYAVRHNPAVYYTNIRAECAGQDVPLGATPDVSARFTFVTPNLCHDMHSSSCTSDSSAEVQAGDQWLSHFLPAVLASPQYRAGRTAVFITWDEDDYSSTQHIPTLVVAPTVPAGGAPTVTFNHYSLLRTTEEMLGLPVLGDVAHASSMRATFDLG